MASFKSFSHIPSVNELLKLPHVMSISQGLSQEAMVKSIRSSLKEVRAQKIASLETIYLKVTEGLRVLQTSSFKPVINATGILIHTNLGRAPLSKKALQKVVEISQGYSTLEFDLTQGKRGERNDHIEKLLCDLTGAESALVVNNNAAAVFLALNTLAFQKMVLVSRGELVEIGNSFRIPDILQKSGAHLKEIGTTNKTKLKDYDIRNACMFLKVHKSNYDIVGFTEEVDLKTLATLAKQKKKILMFDAGSGLFFKHPLFKQEISVSEAIKRGVDLVTFSGDKLLGGPQAGMIIGKKKYIEKLKKNPLYRTLRTDKIVLAALEETLSHYLLANPEEEIPFLQLLTVSTETLKKRALQLKEELKNDVALDIQEDIAKIGGGALPAYSLPTVVLSIFLQKKKLFVFEKKIREGKIPVIGRIQNDRYLIDLRTVFEWQFASLKESLISAMLSL